MKLSIAMATYNGAKYLPQQLRSLVAQTRQPDEVIISDDGSTDGTLNIVEKFSKSAPVEVHVLRNQKNLGYAGNFSRALEAATGDLVFLSDQDDIWFPNKLERLESFANKNPAAQLIMCDAALTDEELKPVGLTKIEQIRYAGLPMSFFVMGCCAAIRREFLDLTLPIPARYPAHDTWLVCIADGLKAKAILEEPLQYYRRHGDNESKFIANELRPITRTYLLWRDLISKMRKRNTSVHDYIDEIEREKLLLWGVERASARSGAGQASRFALLHERITHRIALLEMRLIIHCAPWYHRLPRAITMWRQGGYKSFDGYKSLVRDLMFP